MTFGVPAGAARTAFKDGLLVCFVKGPPGLSRCSSGRRVRGVSDVGEPGAPSGAPDSIVIRLTNGGRPGEPWSFNDQSCPHAVVWPRPASPPAHLSSGCLGGIWLERWCAMPLAISICSRARLRTPWDLRSGDRPRSCKCDLPRMRVRFGLAQPKSLRVASPFRAVPMASSNLPVTDLDAHGTVDT